MTKEELKDYFTPKAELVTKLPNAKDVDDLTQAILDNDNGTYSVYRMLKGSWKLEYTIL